MSKTETALKLALEALEQWNTPLYKRGKAITAIREALAQPEQEPVAWPPVQFEKVAEGVEIGYDLLGGVDIRLGGEFVYVHINYDYRYTHNSARKALADQIVGLLTTPPHRKPLTDVEIWNTYKNLWMFHPAEEPRLAGDVLKFARAIEAAHGIKE